MNENDLVRLHHMLDAAQEALTFIKDKERDAIKSDRLLALALVKEIEIIGEAASRISKSYQDSTPQFAWAEIIGMRNRLIHAYYEVNIDRVWETVVHALPPLIDELLKVINEQDERE
jgi:uncharacterized protein with HEPN domain